MSNSGCSNTPRIVRALLIVRQGLRVLMEQAETVGYSLKTQAAVDFVQAILDAPQGAIYLSPRVARAVVQAYLTKADLPPDPLTSREREILQRIAEGETTKEIAWA